MASGLQRVWGWAQRPGDGERARFGWLGKDFGPKT